MAGDAAESAVKVHGALAGDTDEALQALLDGMHNVDAIVHALEDALASTAAAAANAESTTSAAVAAANGGGAHKHISSRLSHIY